MNKSALVHLRYASLRHEAPCRTGCRAERGKSCWPRQVLLGFAPSEKWEQHTFCAAPTTRYYTAPGGRILRPWGKRATA